jgi:hypothetical protein
MFEVFLLIVAVVLGIFVFPQILEKMENKYHLSKGKCPFCLESGSLKTRFRQNNRRGLYCDCCKKTIIIPDKEMPGLK